MKLNLSINDTDQCCSNNLTLSIENFFRRVKSIFGERKSKLDGFRSFKHKSPQGNSRQGLSAWISYLFTVVILSFRETQKKKKKSLKRCHLSNNVVRSFVVRGKESIKANQENSYRKFFATGYYYFIVFPNKQT